MQPDNGCLCDETSEAQVLDETVANLTEEDFDLFQESNTA
jgi:hypothetical protein